MSRARIALSFAAIALAVCAWLIADRIGGPRVKPRSDALNLQAQAAEIAIVAVWKETVESWGNPPQDLCVSAAVPPDIAAAENYSGLPPDAIKNIQDAVGNGVTVRLMSDCGFTGIRRWMATADGHRAWTIDYYDTDAELLLDRIRGKDSPDRWSDRDSFNTNRQLHVGSPPALEPSVNRAGLMKYDACVTVSRGDYSDEYCFDFQSSQGKVRVAHGHARWFPIIQ